MRMRAKNVFLLLLSFLLLFAGCTKKAETPAAPSATIGATPTPEAALAASAAPEPSAAGSVYWSPPTQIDALPTAAEAGYTIEAPPSIDYDPASREPVLLFEQGDISLWFLSISVVFDDSDVNLSRVRYNMYLMDGGQTSSVIRLEAASVNGMTLPAYLQTPGKSAAQRFVDGSVECQFPDLFDAGVTRIRETRMLFSVAAPDGVTQLIEVTVHSDKDLSGYMETYQDYLEYVNDGYVYRGPAASGQTLFDVSGVTGRLLSLSENADGDAILTVRGENGSEIPIRLRLASISLNNASMGACSVSGDDMLPGTAAIYTITINREKLDLANIQTIGTITTSFHIAPAMTSGEYENTFHPTGTAVSTTSAGAISVEIPSDGAVIYEENGYKILFLERGRFNEYSQCGAALRYAFQNNREEPLGFGIDGILLNSGALSYDSTRYLSSCTVQPGEYAFFELRIADGDVMGSDAGKIASLTGTLCIEIPAGDPNAETLEQPIALFNEP